MKRRGQEVRVEQPQMELQDTQKSNIDKFADYVCSISWSDGFVVTVQKEKGSVIWEGGNLQALKVALELENAGQYEAWKTRLPLLFNEPTLAYGRLTVECGQLEQNSKNVTVLVTDPRQALGILSSGAKRSRPICSKDELLPRPVTRSGAFYLPAPSATTDKGRTPAP